MGYGRRSEIVDGIEQVYCSHHHGYSPVGEFNFRSPLLGLYQYYCRSCQAEIDRKNHAAEKLAERAKIHPLSNDGIELAWCSREKAWKPKSEFNMKYARFGVLQSVCRDCQHERDKESYLRNSQRVQRNNKAMKIKNRALGQEHLYRTLSAARCADCGTNDPAVLTFDHVNGQKKYDVATMISIGYSLKAVKAEIEKTEIVCFNCHMKREAKRRGLFRSLWGKG